MWRDRWPVRCPRSIKAGDARSISSTRSAWQCFRWNMLPRSGALLPIRAIAASAMQPRLRHAGTPLMVVDFLALTPFLIQFFVHADFGAFRVLRIVRFYRLARYVPALETIVRVIVSEARRLLGTLILFAGLLLFSGVLMYIAEGRCSPTSSARFRRQCGGRWSPCRRSAMVTSCRSLLPAS